MSPLKQRLLHRLILTTGLNETEAEHVVEEVFDLFCMDTDAFIVMRHGELQKEGVGGNRIYERIQEDLEDWRFSAEKLSVRQIRRRIYG